jgi:hypothetical protein
VTDSDLTWPIGQFVVPASDPNNVDTDAPTCRATIRDGLVTLNPWSPCQFGHGPVPAGFATITAALADLRMHGDELLVTPVPRTPWNESAEEVILRWAPNVGYRRVWLPDRVVDFDAPAPLRRALVDCPTCGARWDDESARFWERVRGNGWFPGRCLACGGSLPEWSVIESDVQLSDLDHAKRHRTRG